MVKIQVNKANGVHLVAIPRKICKAMGWKKGTEVGFEVMGKDKLKIEKVKITPQEITGGFYDE